MMKKSTSPKFRWGVVVAMFLAPLSTQAEMREFTNQGGQKIQAELISHNGAGMLDLRRADGRTFQISASTLSLDDQAYLKTWMEQNPAKVDYRLDIKASPQKIAGNRKNLGYKIVKNEVWVYNVEIKNLSRDTVADLKAEYRVFASNNADGEFSSYESLGGFVSGEAALKGPYRYNETATFKSKEMKIDTVDYSDVGGRYKDGLLGMMVRIKNAKGEVVVDWVTPTAALKGKTWDNVPKSLEIQSSTNQN